MDLFAEDVTLKYLDGVEITDKTEIALVIQSGHKVPIKYEFVDIEAEGIHVTWMIRRGEGPFVTESLNEATVEGGKIVYWRVLEEITP